MLDLASSGNSAGLSAKVHGQEAYLYVCLVKYWAASSGVLTLAPAATAMARTTCSGLTSSRHLRMAFSSFFIACGVRTRYHRLGGTPDEAAQIRGGSIQT